MNHYPGDKLFIDGILHKLPSAIAASVRNTYGYQYDRQGRQAANLYLLSVEGYTSGKTLLMHSDDTIRHKAQRLVKVCDVKSVEKAAAYLASVGLSLPAGDTDESILARVKCPLFWERALRRKQDREQELLSVQLGHIRKGLQPYCSTALLSRVQARHKRSMEIMAGFEAVSDEGDTLGLLEVLKGSTANPAIRRAELMVRMRGFEDYATQQGHAAMFYTLTCPSKYHRVSGYGLNDNYADTSPREAQRYLCDVWARIRAKLKRDGLNVYGFRVAEPHHDGCPHWHLLLFMDQGHSQAVTAIMQAYALAEDGDEPGAAKHRFEVVQIDAAKGSATGYIAKYVSKNIDGFGMDTDEESGEAASDSAQRVRAWASCWGIRQFQQIGGAPVGVWRELRRIDEAPTELLEEA
ncbi:MAG: replication endonuclease, partial [Thiolinea sp.]